MRWRLRIFFERFVDYIQHLPSRILRFLRWLIWIPPLQGRDKFLRWISGLILLAIDITPLSLLYECLGDFIKIKSRTLNKKEKELAIEIFHNSIPLNLVSVDPASLIAAGKSITGYVTFHNVNYADRITSYAFIHEIVHVWQYRKWGAAYMSEAIWAQKWGGGYDYGGIEALKKHRSTGLKAFNYEQQACIIEEYFRLKQNLPLQWTRRSPDLEELLEGYSREVRT